MARGFFLGLLWGLVIAGVMVIVASELAVRHDIARGPETGAVDVPEGSGFDASRSDLPPDPPAEDDGGDAPSRARPQEPETSADTGLGLPEIEGPVAPSAVDAGPEPTPVPSAEGEEASGASAEVASGEEDSRPGGLPLADIGTLTPDSAPTVEAAPEAPRNDPPELTLGTGAPESPPESDEAEPEIGGMDRAPLNPSRGDAPPPAEPDRRATAPSGLPEVDTAPQATLDAPIAEGEAPRAPSSGDDSSGSRSRPSQPEGGRGEPSPDQAPATPGATTRPAVPDGVEEPVDPGEPAEPSAPSPEAPGAEPGAVPLLPETMAPQVENGAPGDEPDPLTTLMTPGQSAASRVETGRLPQVGAEDPEAPAEDGESASEEDAGDATETEAPDDALRQNAAEFEVPDDRPLLSIVLLDGGDLPVDLPFPATLALSATTPEATLRAQIYRASGHEIVVIPSLPEGATATDTAQALEAGRALLDEAVAVMDSPEGVLQANREALAQVVSLARRTGHGLLAFPRGLNSAARVAEREGVTSDVVFRDIDGDGQDSAAVRRFLDQAAFRARQEGAVIVFARVRPETMTGLAEWVLGSRAESVTLAPLSAVLLQDTLNAE